MDDERRVEFSIYRSFALGRQGGNPAGVVLSRFPLDPGRAGQAANDLCLPTTGFAAPETEDRASVRFFTPIREIAACGHVTVAIAAELARRTGRADDNRLFTIRSPADESRVEIGGSAGITTASIAVSIRDRTVRNDLKDEVGRIAGTALGDVIPPAIVRTGLSHLLVEVRDRASLGRARIDGPDWFEFGRRHLIDTIGLFSAEQSREIHLRDICAPIGDAEEAASGTTCAALGYHLQYSSPSARIEILQGEDMGRPSLLIVEVGDDDVTVSGNMIRVAEGIIDLSLDGV